MNNLKDAAIYLRYADAIAEYRRLCDLIGGRPPFGDCELVALLIYRAVSGGTKKIVRGWIEFEDDERTEHFWVEVDGEILDPLANDFTRPVISWLPIESYSPQQIVRDLEAFLADFPYPWSGTPFPLRWKVRL
ncbi:hypothetical protein [Microseira sp. BLCC-F43]|jgi:hypothetical protein|uniref:hypothetical protein n=1 Tax=Microseira sp. BLCC-F43 TaxID=3153602 RepID=UPI0035B97E40